MDEISDEQLMRYARHVVLKEVGEEGQIALLESKVLVVGAGGLGSPALMYLAAAGVGTLGVVDDDVNGSKAIHGLFDHAVRRLVVRDRIEIGFSLAAGVADFLHRLHSRHLVIAFALGRAAQVINDNLGAVGRQHLGDIRTDPAPSAGNEGDLVLDQFRVCHDALPMIVGSAPAELPIKGQVKRDHIEILFAVLYYAGE